ncbi:DUF3800 domain-containing protein, partial [Caldisericum sp.]|uniref:DUF3800 domain-containing protein n=1 Tax=Caldisericum sp. TaxID=2499687 RepID=UPI003D12F20B
MKGFNDILDIYTDESASESGRFRAICAISGLSNNLEKLKEELKSKINLYGLSELKFAEVKTHQPKVNCAKDFISVAVDYASRREIRIDVIIWDLHDSRHSIQGRDDKENLERMYFHLLRNVVERWGIFICRFYPDEHSEYDYQEIIDYLNATKYPRKEPGILKFFEDVRIRFSFKEVIPQRSEEQPLIQLADL